MEPRRHCARRRAAVDAMHPMQSLSPLFFFSCVLLISCPRFGARGRPPPLHHPHGPYATPFYDEGCSPNPPHTHARKKKNKKKLADAFPIPSRENAFSVNKKKRLNYHLFFIFIITRAWFFFSNTLVKLVRSISNPCGDALLSASARLGPGEVLCGRAPASCVCSPGRAGMHFCKSPRVGLRSRAAQRSYPNPCTSETPDGPSAQPRPKGNTRGKQIWPYCFLIRNLQHVNISVHAFFLPILVEVFLPSASTFQPSSSSSCRARCWRREACRSTYWLACLAPLAPARRFVAGPRSARWCACPGQVQPGARQRAARTPRIMPRTQALRAAARRCLALPGTPRIHDGARPALAAATPPSHWLARPRGGAWRVVGVAGRGRTPRCAALRDAVPSRAASVPPGKRTSLQAARRACVSLYARAV